MLAALSCALVACQTAAEQSNTNGQRLNATYASQPLTAYMSTYAVTPDEAFDSGSQRVFIFKRAPCQAWFYTSPIGTARSPDSYRIERIDVKGSCL
ncbi:hypothetical protein [Phyllobacterium sp. UNC302MFCol5.2]|uniref:hypothetical protein n=1 Tax=Phyllobacterium sp. UNC302MFCol5.2 TaxID=1449065 RepID=UPI00048400DA|nr:hypothetical protein [Phyllobacterium sp. UNC302MFCol5.2]